MTRRTQLTVTNYASSMKALLRRVLPAKYHLVSQLAKAITKGAHSCVISGPFAGMRYVADSVGSRHSPKLLGTYEIELHDIINQIIVKKPEIIFNIGAAEGYYTVGLARALPASRLSAWETTETGRALSRTLAKLNGIDDERIELHGFCTVSELRKSLEGLNPISSVLLIVDIEGGEALLLDPEVIPRLRQCEMLVEVHECFIPGVRQLLVDRFCTTHSVVEIQATQRSLADWPAALSSSRNRVWNGAKVALMNERRPHGMSWLYLEKK